VRCKSAASAPSAATPKCRSTSVSSARRTATLESAIEDERFREDLYFRVNVVHVQMPPLRARGSDVLLLAQHFLVRYAAQSGKHVAGLSPAAAERLMAYSWPGNVRELQNCIERAVALTTFEHLAVDDLPEKVRAYRPLARDRRERRSLGAR